MRGLMNATNLPPSGLWLLAATFVTTVGNGMQTLALSKLLYDQSGSAAAFGVILLFEQGLNIVMQLIAGPWVDRGDPQRTCVRVEFIRGICICLVSFCLGSQNLLWWIVLMSLVIRVAQPFYRAATFALAPAAIPGESLERFNGYSNICLQGGQLCGVALAGVVLQFWGTPAAILTNGVTFLFSGLAVAMIKVPQLEEVSPKFQPPQFVWQHLFSGWKDILLLLRQEIGLAWHLLLSTADGIIVILFNLLLVPLVAERYGGSTYWLSAVDGGFTVGAMFSAAVVSSISTRWGTWAATTIGISGQAVCFIGLGLTSDIWLTLALVFGIGTFNTISWVVLTTALQLRVQGSIKGRIATVRNLLTASFGAVLVPLISQTASVSLVGAMFLSGTVCLGYALIAVLFGQSLTSKPSLLPETSNLGDDPKH
jgi:MFS transporter, DHA3 family, macrolide efflux protein